MMLFPAVKKQVMKLILLTKKNDIILLHTVAYPDTYYLN